jgi:hypothetical protein
MNFIEKFMKFPLISPTKNLSVTPGETTEKVETNERENNIIVCKSTQDR